MRCTLGPQGLPGGLFEEELLELRVSLGLRAPPASGVFVAVRGFPGPAGCSWGRVAFLDLSGLLRLQGFQSASVL